MAEISVRLAEVRAKQRLSQQEVADRAGIRRATISDLERGKSQGIEFDTLARLCVALEVPLDEILNLGEIEDLRTQGLDS